jgi:hypothetical protein
VSHWAFWQSFQPGCFSQMTFNLLNCVDFCETSVYCNEIFAKTAYRFD